MHDPARQPRWRWPPHGPSRLPSDQSHPPNVPAACVFHSASPCDSKGRHAGWPSWRSRAAGGCLLSGYRRRSGAGGGDRQHLPGGLTGGDRFLPPMISPRRRMPERDADHAGLRENLPLRWLAMPMSRPGLRVWHRARSSPWLPQETILFDGARLRRKLMPSRSRRASSACWRWKRCWPRPQGSRSESLTHGLIHAIPGGCGRAGKLVFAEETAFEGDLAATARRRRHAQGGERLCQRIVLAAPDAAPRGLDGAASYLTIRCS